MKITVFGSGYVGLVTGACFAEVGNDVLCVDIDEQKIARLKQGRIPIYEPGLDKLVARNTQAGRLNFTTDPARGVAHGLFQFIAVGTPPDEDGSADLQYVLAVAGDIAAHMDGYKVIVDKSTVPVGTADKVKARVAEALAERGANLEFDVVSNPEFLKEGAAIDDFMQPDRVVVGTDNPRTAELLHELYAAFTRKRDRLLVMDIRSAELTKYAANCMLATKISFMNDLSNLAERVGADIEAVRLGIGSDPRIGYHFIYPGAGYGGSCFPKDVQALIHTARANGHAPLLLEAVEAVNQRQKQRLVEKVLHHFNGNVQGKTFALWGLAFKPNTDDMREAPSRVFMEALWDQGACIRAYDPAAAEEVERIYGKDREGLVLAESAQDALAGADALVVMTEWREFRSPDFAYIKKALSHPVIFDGRNMYAPDALERLGITYYGIGRGRSEYV